MNPIRIKPSTAPTIKIKPSTERILDPAEVAKALGAKPTGVRTESALGPFTLFALRQELFRRLQSTGGRPGLPDADKVGKVPLSEKQWARLEELAAAIAEEGFSPSAGQVAHVLLTWALDALGRDAIKKLAADLKASEHGPK
jgi:hypothetical protein